MVFAQLDEPLETSLKRCGTRNCRVVDQIEVVGFPNRDFARFVEGRILGAATEELTGKVILDMGILEMCLQFQPIEVWEIAAERHASHINHCFYAEVMDKPNKSIYVVITVAQGINYTMLIHIRLLCSSASCTR